MIDALSRFHFIRPAALLLLPLAWGIWKFWRWRADPLRGWRAQMDAELLDPLVQGRRGTRDLGSYGLLVAWLLAAVALAGPTWRREPNPFAADAQPLVILLKADKSMLATNPAPSRLERARLKIADIAKARPGQPLALIAYAGSAHLVLPPTRDTDAVAQMAAEISPAIMPVAGDRLDLAVQEAAQLLHDEPGALLVVADSTETDPQRLAAAHQAAAGAPIEILALAAADAPETKLLREAAKSLGAAVVLLTPDETDVRQIVAFAERRASLGLGGEGTRWQEAGYWLTPVLALLVALSFRRETSATGETV